MADMLRKHHITALLQTLLVLCTFSSCIYDELADDIASTDRLATHPCYLNIQLKFDENMSSTRAAVTNGDNLEYGEHNEHMIGPDGNFIILFKDASLFDVCELVRMTGHEHNTEDEREGDNKTNNVPDNIEAIYTYYSKFNAEEEKDFPTSCLVVLNASEKISNKLKEFKEDKEEKKVSFNVNDILSIVWDETKVEDNPKDIGFSDNTHKYFTLTNSIYFDNNELQATKEIPAAFVGKTLAEAKALTIYVERMVSKFSFKDEGSGESHVYNKEKFNLVYCNGFTTENNGTQSDEDAKNHAPKLVEKPYTIKLTGWGINAFETKNNIFKKINNKTYFSGWNNAANYRAHWSEDPHYDKDKNGKNLKYPWQNRLAVDYPLDYYEEEYPNIGATNNNYLRNYGFKDLNGEDDNGNYDIDKNFNAKRFVYTPENTYDPSIYGKDGMEDDFDSRTELLAGTHLIVCAELQTELGEGETKNDIYRDRKGIFYKNQKECFWALVRAFNLALQSKEKMKYRYYNWTTNKGTFGVQHEALTMQNDYYVYKDTVSEWDAQVDIAMKRKYDDENVNKDYSGAYKELLPEKKNSSKYSHVTNVGIYKLYRKVEGVATPIEVTYDYIMGLDDNTQFFIPADVKDGDGKVLPWLDGLTIRRDKGNGTSEEGLDIYYQVDIRNSYLTGDPVAVGNIQRNSPNDNDMKSLILEWMGAVDHFNEGKMYYAAPVKHYAAQSDYAAERNRTADYGVVRNNWYKFTLSDVTKIGTPVHNISEPIVPNKVTTNDQLNISVNILQWHPLESTVNIIQ